MQAYRFWQLSCHCALKYGTFCNFLQIFDAKFHFYLVLYLVFLQRFFKIKFFLIFQIGRTDCNSKFFVLETKWLICAPKRLNYFATTEHHDTILPLLHLNDCGEKLVHSNQEKFQNCQNCETHTQHLTGKGGQLSLAQTIYK